MRRDDVVTQAELRKGTELITNQSSAVRLICDSYLNALSRRVAGGAAVEPGPLTFDPVSKVICIRKQPGSEPVLPRANSA